MCCDSIWKVITKCSLVKSSISFPVAFPIFPRTVVSQIHWLVRQFIKKLRKMPLGSGIRSREKNWSPGLKKSILPITYLHSIELGVAGDLAFCCADHQTSLLWSFQYSDDLMTVGRQLLGPVDRAGLGLNWQVKLKRWDKLIRKTSNPGGECKSTHSSSSFCFFTIENKLYICSLIGTSRSNLFNSKL